MSRTRRISIAGRCRGGRRLAGFSERAQRDQRHVSPRQRGRQVVERLEPLLEEPHHAEGKALVEDAHGPCVELSPETAGLLLKVLDTLDELRGDIARLVGSAWRDQLQRPARGEHHADQVPPPKPEEATP